MQAYCDESISRSNAVAPMALLLEGMNRRSERNWLAALQCFEAAALAAPGLIAPKLLQAEVLINLGQYREALAVAQHFPPTPQGGRDAARLRWKVAYAALIYEAPTRDAQLATIDVLLQLGQPLPALARCEQLLSRDPYDDEARHGKGHALAVLERYEEALVAYASTPGKSDDALLLYNRATVLQRLQRFEEAIALYDLACAREPGFADAEMECAHCFLALGDFARGWPRYEARWRTLQARNVPKPSNQARWQGEPLEGKRIVLWPEQGLGDCILCLRFVSEIAKRAAQTILVLPKELVPLASCLPMHIDVASQGDELEEHDFQCPLMSLPWALGVTFHNVPAAAGFLTPPADAIARWKSKLGNDKRPRIGLVWATKLVGTDPRRRMPMQFLAPVLGLNARFISLQKQFPASDKAFYTAQPHIESFVDQLSDFAETAALIANLDLVITVDTAIAHLAGAIGKPFWVLLPHASDWRWQPRRAESVWYKSARLFRQPHHGDWAGLTREVAAALNGYLQQFAA